MTPTIVLFDIDGTLITCGGAGRRSMEGAAIARGITPSACEFEFGGMTDRAIARAILEHAGEACDDREIDSLIEEYLTRLEREVANSERYRVLEGVLDLVAALEGRDVAMGLGTGNVERGARTKLARAQLGTRFSFGGFGCDHELRAELLRAGARRGAQKLGVPLDSAQVIVIGDTPKDVAAARAIGAKCIAVATGSFDQTMLRAAQPDWLVDDLRDPQVLQWIASPR